jgi:hypothetical protein
MDYRFAIRCWQDQAGDENAKANVFVDGVQVATEVEITATSADTPQIIAWESTGLTAPAADTSFDIKVVLVNEYYVDANTDRNINIDGIGYLTKAADGNYKLGGYDDSDPAVYSETTVADFTDFDNYRNNVIPTAVTGDQIADDWWSSRTSDGFYTVVVWGNNANTGVTMATPIIGYTCLEA